MKKLTFSFIICLLAGTFYVNAQANKQRPLFPPAEKNSLFDFIHNAEKNNSAHKNVSKRTATDPFLPSLDSAIEWNLDTSSGSFNIPYIKVIVLSHDALHNDTRMVFQEWNDTAFADVELETDSFNLNGDEVSTFYQVWNGTAWVNFRQYLYTYDGHYNQTSALQQQWISGAWQNSQLYTFSYDDNNNMLTDSAFFMWDSTAFSEGTFYNNAYDSGNHLIQQDLSILYDSAYDPLTRMLYVRDVNNDSLLITEQSWDGSSYTTQYEDTFYYDINNNMVEDTRLDSTGAGFVYDYNYLYTYDGNHNMLTSVYQVAAGGWLNQYKTTNTYDADNNRLTSQLTLWDGTGFNINNYFLSSTFTAGNLIQSELQLFYDSTNTVTSGDSAYYYYDSGIPATIKNVKNNSGITVYPNPASTLLTVTAPAMNGIMHIYDVTGREMTAEVKIASTGNTGFQLDISALDQGIYFLRIRSQNALAVKEFVKE